MSMPRSTIVSRSVRTAERRAERICGTALG